ncbi:MAG: LysM peptidoglycan-binding domain-containing protein [Opitutales bacterium]
MRAKPTRFLPTFILLSATLLLAACFSGDDYTLVQEDQERAFQRARQYLREGRQQEALHSFLRVIDQRRGDAPESHLDAGEIFLNHLKDPIEAIHHFRKYLELKPDSPQADLVRGRIDRAMKDVARILPGQPMENPLERLDLLDLTERLKEENLELKREVVELREEISRLGSVPSREAEPNTTQSASTNQPSSPSSPSQETRPETEADPRTYEVVSGDTLYRISAKVYGNSRYWEEIYEANRDLLPSENALRIGMTLRIPPREE